jgi:Glycosyltransferase like family 2
MPFAGDVGAAAEAIAALQSLNAGRGDELIIADNSGTVASTDEVQVVGAEGERSPARARNVGASYAKRDWILFLDADCEPAPDLLDSYFELDVEDTVGALAGEVAASADASSIAERYGASRGFLGQQLHLNHPYMPRAVAANLMVRREVFAQLGGFYEGLRAAEDTDFSWRLQRAGWRLEPRPSARVQHRYRASVGELRQQWRGYAAGRAWLGRRYEGFRPQPALLRVLGGRSGSARRQPEQTDTGKRGPAIATTQRREPATFIALDALLGLEELAGLLLSNRPTGDADQPQPEVVLVAERFPAIGDPLSEFARTLSASRVEATTRPAAVDLATTRKLRINYSEDAGVLAGWLALLRLAARHPVRCVRDLIGRDRAQPPLRELATAALRIDHDSGARLRALGGEDAHVLARRLAQVSGRSLES